MNTKQAQMSYLAWLRDTAPTLYVTAVRRATGRTKSLGGLNDDLVQSALSPGYRHSFLGDNGDSVTLDPIDVSSISLDQPITTDFSFDTSTPTFDTSSVGPLQTVNTGYATGPTSTVTTPATPAASSSTFANILSAVAAVGTAAVGVVGAENTSSLIALNTQRAAQGLPPVNAQGQVVGAAGSASPALLAFENAITGGGGSLLPILLIGGVLAYFLLGGKKSATV
jgi:hypothetical protein